MLNPKMAQRESGLVEDGFAGLADGGLELSLLLAAEKEARVTLARAIEDAAIEAQDVLSQADEALVLG